MNLILLFPEDFVPGALDRVLLRGRRLLHVTQIQRASVGDELRVGVVDGKIGTGRINVLDSDRLEMQVHLDRQPPAPSPATLVLALPRPPMLKRVLHAVTTMGVKRIALIGARRVERSFWDSRALQDDAVREQLILGLEQACDTVLPEVRMSRRFKPFVMDELPEWSAGSLALVAHPGAAIECPRQVARPITLAVGPEGGFSDFEIETFEGQGFTAIHFGERILRVEAAVPALLSRLL